MAELGFLGVTAVDLPLNTQVFHTTHLCAKPQTLVKTPKSAVNFITLPFTWDAGVNAVL